MKSSDRVCAVLARARPPRICFPVCPVAPITVIDLVGIPQTIAPKRGIGKWQADASFQRALESWGVVGVYNKLARLPRGSADELSTNQPRGPDAFACSGTRSGATMTDMHSTAIEGFAFIPGGVDPAGRAQ